MSQKHFTELYTDCWVFEAFHGWQLRIIFWRKSYISSGILRLCTSDFNNYSCWILMKSWDCSLRISENETEDPSRWVRPFLAGAFGLKKMTNSIHWFPPAASTPDLCTMVASQWQLCQHWLFSLRLLRPLRVFSLHYLRPQVGLEVVKSIPNPGTWLDLEAPCRGRCWLA